MTQSEIIEVLLVEDNHKDARLIQALLADAKDSVNFDLECADWLQSGLERLARGGIDIVLLDISLPDSQGLDILVKARAQAPGVPIVVLGSPDDEALAAQALQKGAQDYLVKGQVDSNLLVRSMRYAIERQRMLGELEQYTQQSQALLYSLDNIIQKNPDGIVIVDRTGVVRFVNPAAESLLNRKSEELIGKMFGFPVVAGEKTELHIIHKAREVATVEMRVIELEWKGEIVYLASLHDITEREELERRRKEAEELYATLANSSHVGIYITQDEKFQFVNPQFQKYTGFSQDELLGMDLLRLVHPKDRSLVKENAVNMLNGERFSTYDFRVITKDGETRWVMETVTPIQYKGERATLGSHMDITEHRKLGEQLEHSCIDLAETVSRAMGSRDPYTAGHQRRVAEMVRLVGEKMGLDKGRLNGLYIGGLLHDIGKISTPETILTKPGKLGSEEWHLIRKHTKEGHKILKDAKLPCQVADMALHHHERLDGSGYPHGISGDKLSLEVRILAVCDVVEAMSSFRPYRPARSKAEVLEEIKGGKGTKYDANVVDIILEIIENGEFELELQLSSSPSPGGRELEGGGFTMKGSPRQIARARELRQSQTDAEKALWARLRNKQLEGMKFRRQQPLGPYVIDFVSLERKIIVEVDGGQHNEREAREKDKERAAWLRERGYQVLRFWNNEVLTNMEGVLEKIEEVLR